jgi:large subunit ribosomal protein L25
LRFKEDFFLELLELTANVRKTTGKGAGRALRREGFIPGVALRREGFIPGVLYGPKTDPIILTVSIRELEKLIKDSGSAQALMNLTIQNGDSIKKTAMIKELQVHPVSRNFIHVDFYEIAMDQKIQVQVAVEVVGDAPGVEAGGALQIIRREIDILSLPMDIPESIVIDVSKMQIGDSIHVEELPVPGGVEILADTNFTVITVSSPMAEEQPEEEEAEEEVEGEEGEASGEQESGE